MKPLTAVFAAVSALLLTACASAPTGPSVMALPGTGKNFEQFRSDDATCRQYAQEQSGGATAEAAASNAGVRSAAVGAVVGAVAGAVVGAVAGAAIGGRDSAGAGAGAGLVVGSIAGSGAARETGYGTQRHYDNAYVQCMYAKGEKVPVSGTLARRQVVAPASAVTVAPATPTGAYPPPPPPGYGAPIPPPR